MTGQTGKLNRSDRSTILIYVAKLITPLCRSRRVDQFTYLIFPNQTLNEKVMRFRSFQIYEPTHTSQIGMNRSDLI
jgi:hypothetical protein